MSATTEDPITFSAQNNHSRCWLCGNLNPRSLKLTFQPAGKGTVTARFQAHPELQGYAGMLHGGVISSLLDAAMTHCLFHQGVRAVTGDLHVRFVQPVPSNVSLEIRAWVLSFQRPLYRLRAEIIFAERVVAWAEAKFMERRKEMEKNKNSEVLEGEILDDAKEKSNALAANGTAMDKKENRMEKAGKWIDTIAFIGGGLLKFFSILSKNTPFDTHENSGKNDFSSGRKRRRQGRHFK